MAEMTTGREVFSQAGQEVKRPAGIDALGGVDA